MDLLRRHLPCLLVIYVVLSGVYLMDSVSPQVVDKRDSDARLKANDVPTRQTSYDVDTNDGRQSADVLRIVESLRNLGVLDRDWTCDGLDQITKLEERTDDQQEWTISVTFTFRSSPQPDIQTTPTAVGPEDVMSSQAAPNSSTRDCLPSTANVSSSSNDTSRPPPCPEPGKRSSEAMDVVAGTPTAEVSGAKKGLNLAQYLAISTCSTIVALFFVVALTLRIRNYLKRKLMENHRQRAYRDAEFSPGGATVCDMEPDDFARGHPASLLNRIQWFAQDYLLNS